MTLNPEILSPVNCLIRFTSVSISSFLYLPMTPTTKTSPNPAVNGWMQAIDDSLDKEVNEEKYTNPLIKNIFEIIKQDQISPEERARMKEEHNQEEGEKRAFEEGEEKKAKETASHMKTLGVLTDEQIAQATGLTVKIVKDL